MTPVTPHLVLIQSPTVDSVPKLQSLLGLIPLPLGFGFSNWGLELTLIPDDFHLFGGPAHIMEGQISFKGSFVCMIQGDGRMEESIDCCTPALRGHPTLYQGR